MLESNRDRWINWADDEKNNVTVTKENLRKDPRYKPLYSVTSHGQEKFRGFSDEGLNRFEELKERVMDNRVHDLKKFSTTCNGEDVVSFGREGDMREVIVKKFDKKFATQEANKKRRNQEKQVVARKKICSREEDNVFDVMLEWNKLHGANGNAAGLVVQNRASV